MIFLEIKAMTLSVEKYYDEDIIRQNDGIN